MCACWVYKDALQVAAVINTPGKLVLNINELQSTSTNPLHQHSSFHLLPPSGNLPYIQNTSFSPVSFHISIITSTEVIILNAKDSKLLFQTKVNEVDLKGEFSPNGHFFALFGLEGVYVCHNTPTGYVLWSSFRAQFLVEALWSPTSVSVLCWGGLAIQVFHTDNSFHLPPPDDNGAGFQGGDHIIAHFTDGIHIATARQQGSVITVLNCRSGTTLQFINADMEIWDIKVIDNTIFAVNPHKLASWKLEVGAMAYSAYSARRVVIDATVGYLTHLLLSNDCSQIAFASDARVFLYDVETQRILKSINWDVAFMGMWFSPDGHKLWLTRNSWLTSRGHEFMELYMTADWATAEGSFKLGGSRQYGLYNEWDGLDIDSLIWSANLVSPHGCYVCINSQWVTDSRGRKLLWLPPPWRIRKGWEMRWDDNFLILLHDHHPVPIIIEFQP